VFYINRTVFFTLFFFSFILNVGCSTVNNSSSRWGNLYTPEEQQEITLKHVKPNIRLGKKQADDSLLQSCKSRLIFLDRTYNNPEARQLIAEIDSFYNDYYSYFQELISNTLKKNFIFTTAGYYKRLQKLFPDDPEAEAFFSENDAEIQKRYKTNLWVVEKYLSQKRYDAAIRVYRRILNYDPANTEAQDGIAKARELKHDERLKRQRKIAIAKVRKERQKKLALKRAAQKKKTTDQELNENELTEPNQTDRQAEILYVKGVKAYREKRFIDAKVHFEAILNADYKDTRLYLDRIEDKIQALGLEGGDED